MNGTQSEQHPVSLGRLGSPAFSDIEPEDLQEEGHLGDYSTRLEEVMTRGRVV